MTRFGTRFLSRIPALVAAAAVLAAAAPGATADESPLPTLAEGSSFADRLQRCVDAAVPALAGMEEACSNLVGQCETVRARTDAVRVRCEKMRAAESLCQNGVVSDPRADTEALREALLEVGAAIELAESGFSGDVPDGATSFAEHQAAFRKAESIWDDVIRQVRREKRGNSEANDAWQIFYPSSGKGPRVFGGSGGYSEEAKRLEDCHRVLSKQFLELKNQHADRLASYHNLLGSLKSWQASIQGRIEPVSVVGPQPPQPPLKTRLKFVVSGGAVRENGEPYPAEQEKEVESGESFHVEDPHRRFHVFKGWRCTDVRDTEPVPSFAEGVMGDFKGRFFTAVFEEVPAKAVYFDVKGQEKIRDGILRSRQPALEDPENVFAGEPDRIKSWGLRFSHWQIATNGTPDRPEWTIEVKGWETMPVRSETTWVRPVFVPAKFPVSFEGAGTVELELDEKLPETAVPPKPHYEGRGWSADAAAEAPDFAPAERPVLRSLLHEPETGLALHPVYAPVPYDVSFRSRTAADARADAWSTNLTATVETRFASAPVPEPSVPHHAFLGWFPEGVEKPFCFNEETRITKSLALFARFRPIEYCASFEGVETSVVFSAEHPLAPPPDPPAREGRDFLGWAIGDASEPFDFTAGSDTLLGTNPAFRSVWKLRIYSISFLDGDRRTNVTATIETRFPPAPVPDPTRPHREFLGWFAEGAEAPFAFDEETRITNNCVLSARFRPIEYKASFEGTSETIPFSADHPLQAPPAPPSAPEGNDFSGWALGAASEPFDFPAGSDALLGSNPTFRPVWKVREYMVAFWPTTSRKDAFTVQVPHGGFVPRPADPVRDGYAFAGWGDSEVSSGPFHDFERPVTGSFSLYGRWRRAPTGVRTSGDFGGGGSNLGSSPGVMDGFLRWFFSSVQWLSGHGLTPVYAWILDGILLLLLILILVRRR